MRGGMLKFCDLQLEGVHIDKSWLRQRLRGAL